MITQGVAFKHNIFISLYCKHKKCCAWTKSGTGNKERKKIGKMKNEN